MEIKSNQVTKVRLIDANALKKAWMYGDHSKHFVDFIDDAPTIGNKNAIARHERYIISDEEIELLNRYAEIMAQSKDPYRYDTFDATTLAQFCRMKDRSNNLYFKRTQAARDVIDLIAKQVGIDPENTGFWLYAPDIDGTSPIVKRMEDWLSRSGEKAKLKRKLQELEQENALLRSLIQKQM